MEKKFNARVVAQIKNIYKVNEQDYNRMKKIEDKMASLQEEYNLLKVSTENMEERVKTVTGGYTSRDLIEVVVTPLFNEDGTPKMDAEGKYQQKKKTYALKYPDTFLPVEAPAEEAETVNNAEEAVETEVPAEVVEGTEAPTL